MTNRKFKGVWISKEIWLAEDLGWSEKLLLVEIDSLDGEQGCFASNDYLAAFFNLSKGRVSKMISSLRDKGYITVTMQYKAGTKNIEKRIIRVNKTGVVKNDDISSQKQLEGIVENVYTPITENSQDNKTSLNNSINNTNTATASNLLNTPSYKEELTENHEQQETQFIEDIDADGVLLSNPIDSKDLSDFEAYYANQPTDESQYPEPLCIENEQLLTADLTDKLNKEQLKTTAASNLLSVSNYYKEQLHEELTNDQKRQLKPFITDKDGAGIIFYAIDCAVNNPPIETFNYVIGLLKKWRKEGCYRLSDTIKANEEFKRSKQEQPNKKQQPLDNEELEYQRQIEKYGHCKGLPDLDF